jgi:hypothetical protein
VVVVVVVLEDDVGALKLPLLEALGALKLPLLEALEADEELTLRPPPPPDEWPPPPPPPGLASTAETSAILHTRTINNFLNIPTP